VEEGCEEEVERGYGEKLGLHRDGEKPLSSCIRESLQARSHGKRLGIIAFGGLVHFFFHQKRLQKLPQTGPMCSVLMGS